MAIAVRGVGATIGSSSATTGIAITVTPNMPTGVVLLDRVFIYAVSTGTVATPTGWQLLFTGALGGGTAGDTTGTRVLSVFYREYDGAWTMPLLTSALVAAVAPGIICGTTAFFKGDDESWPVPTVGTGSDTTSGTGYSVATGSFADPTDSIVTLFYGWPLSPGTLSALSLTATGATFGGNTNRHGIAGQTTGRDVFMSTWTFPVTVGATAAHTAAVTGTIAGTAGAVVISQTTTPVLASQVWNWDDNTNQGFNPGTNWTIAFSAVRSVSTPNSLLCTRANTTAGGGYTQSPFIAVEPNTRYKISVWVFASAATTYQISVAGNMSTARLVNFNFTPPAGAWQQVACQIITGPTDTMLSVYVTDDPNATPTNASTINIDNLTVQPDFVEKIPPNRTALMRASLW